MIAPIVLWFDAVHFVLKHLLYWVKIADLRYGCGGRVSQGGRSMERMEWWTTGDDCAAAAAMTTTAATTAAE